MPRRDEYELRVLQEATVGGCNGGCGGYNVGGYNAAVAIMLAAMQW